MARRTPDEQTAALRAERQRLEAEGQEVTAEAREIDRELKLIPQRNRAALARAARRQPGESVDDVYADTARLKAAQAANQAHAEGLATAVEQIGREIAGVVNANLPFYESKAHAASEAAHAAYETALAAVRDARDARETAEGHWGLVQSVRRRQGGLDVPDVPWSGRLAGALWEMQRGYELPWPRGRRDFDALVEADEAAGIARPR